MNQEFLLVILMVLLDLRVSFTTLPQGMDLILGLDSKLSRDDLDRNEALMRIW